MRRSPGRRRTRPRPTRPGCGRSPREIRFEADGLRFLLVHGSPAPDQRVPLRGQARRDLRADRGGSGRRRDRLRPHPPAVRQDGRLATGSSTTDRPASPRTATRGRAGRSSTPPPDTVEFRRVDYDVERAARPSWRATCRASSPPSSARRAATGRQIPDGRGGMSAKYAQIADHRDSDDRRVRYLLAATAASSCAISIVVARCLPVRIAELARACRDRPLGGPLVRVGRRPPAPDSPAERVPRIRRRGPRPPATRRQPAPARARARGRRADRPAVPRARRGRPRPRARCSPSNAMPSPGSGTTSIGSTAKLIDLEDPPSPPLAATRKEASDVRRTRSASCSCAPATARAARSPRPSWRDFGGADFEVHSAGTEADAGEPVRDPGPRRASASTGRARGASRSTSSSASASTTSSRSAIGRARRARSFPGREHAALGPRRSVRGRGNRRREARRVPPHQLEMTTRLRPFVEIALRAAGRRGRRASIAG